MGPNCSRFGVFIMMTMKINLNKYTAIPTIIIIATVTTILFCHCPGSISPSTNDTALTSEDPLHDAVILYWQGNREDAKQLLLRLSGVDKYAAKAFINYGLLMEKEGEFGEAEKSYRKALRRNDNTALFYLINLASRLGGPMSDRLFSAAGNIASAESSFRVEYRRAEECLIRGDTDCALERLESAVKGGMPLGALIYYDPLFRPLLDNPRFREIITAARKNKARDGTLADIMETAEESHYKNKPRGMSRELIKAFTLPVMESDKAGETLIPLLATPLSVRDRAIALYWLARIYAKRNNYPEARRYLSEFKTQIRMGGADRSGFSSLINRIEQDLYANDPLIKNIR